MRHCSRRSFWACSGNERQVMRHLRGSSAAPRRRCCITVNLSVTIVVSLLTKPRPEEELVGLVYSLTPKPVEHHLPWYSRPVTLGIGVLAILLVLNLVFA